MGDCCGPAEGRCRRVGLLESAASRHSGWYTPPKAKYVVGRPIAHKYREGKMKSTLKRDLIEFEIVEKEAIV